MHAMLVAATLSLVLGGPAGPPPDPVQAFQARVDAYVELHRRLEVALPPMAESDPWLRGENRARLADAIRRARPAAREGEIFTRDVVPVLRMTIAETLTPRDFALLQDERWPTCDAAVNERLPEGTSHAVPARLLAVLPRLRGDLEYRIVNADLVLWDTHADLVVDVLRDAFAAPSFV